MTDVDDLVTELERDPGADIFALMLVDILQERRGMLYTEALMHVHRVREAAAAALLLATAARHLATGSRYRARLHRAIRQRMGIATATRMTVLATDGDDVRVSVPAPWQFVGDYWPYVTVSVGARWVTDAVAQMDREDDERKTRRILRRMTD